MEESWKKIEELEKRVQGDIKRELKWDEKMRKEMVEEKRRTDKQIKKVTEKVKDFETKWGNKEKKYLETKEVDKSRTLVIKTAANCFSRMLSQRELINYIK